ncbi:RHS repeat-associated core domain-containing protein [Streptomyces sp. NBC_00103]|uniref:RHS repeat-associated core domain-containing protein n=1 Tax=Streptomyces sp. NBC_00103 TaxID=2975653 RepID=UPI002B1E7FD9|nr:RHS repeat-associated core domain-containing protein [Streptomyces sp. NBC_00103]
MLQETLGSEPNQAFLTNEYDPHTGALTDQLVTRSATNTPSKVDEQNYTHDAAGNITKQITTRLGATAATETQCYQYDELDRLTQAWTATDSCDAVPTASAHAQIGDPLTGGTAYWTSWDFDALGQRQHQVEHSTTGGSDTTTSYNYDYNGNGTVQPHALASTQASGASTAATSYAYDKAGNTTTRNTVASGSQTLTWNDAGQLTQVSGGKTGTTSYIYDADGNVLLQTDPTSTTLYLPGEQLTLTGTTTTGVRYLPLPGGGTAVRTGTGTNYKFEISDPHGTSSLYLDNTAQTPTWRQFTPYGSTRGTTVNWLDNRGFLNAPDNTNTGLTQLGARQYDPTLGRFASLDPLFEATDDQQLAGYSYAAGNPVNKSDPSGLCAGPDCPTRNCPSCLNSTPGNKVSTDAAMRDEFGTGSTPTNTVASKSGTANSGGGGHGHWSHVVSHKSGLGGYVSGFVDQVKDMGAGVVNQALSNIDTVGDCLLGDGWGSCAGLTVPGVIAKQAIPALMGMKDTAVSIYTEYKNGDGEHATGRIGAFALVAILTGGRGSAAEADEAGAVARGCKSFTPETPVLLANGKSKPIGKVKLGDKVATADSKAGKRKGARVVSAVWINHDYDLVDLRIRQADGTVSVLHTTAKHLIWDDTLHEWVPTGSLAVGHALNTAMNQHVSVVSVTARLGDQYMYNLTVNDLHTYYVLAGATPVLVHNCNVRLTQAEADTLQVGPYARGSVPATGPVVTPAQSAAMQGRACHTCGGTTPTMIGDHQPSTGIGPASLP